jgi:hypothetical protein
VDSSIGVNPASLLFGNTINLDRGIISPLVKLDTGIISSKTISNEAVSISNDEQKNTKNNVLSNWSSEMLQLQEAIIKAAQETQLINDAHHFTTSISKPITEFENDSYVLVKYREGLPNKLNTNLKGPMKVIHHFGPTYTLENLVTGKHEKYHVTQLRTFHFDAEKQNPSDIANKDYFLTVVDSIIAHQPIKENYKKQKVSELKFQVRWKDLPPENDRIIAWKELRNNPKLHEYLANNPKLKHLIPNEFKKKQNK